MERLAEYYEVCCFISSALSVYLWSFLPQLIVFTASLSKYADPLLDLLDTKRVPKHCFILFSCILIECMRQVISKRLFREHCVFYDGETIPESLYCTQS